MKKVFVVFLVLILGIGGGVGMYALSLRLNKEETAEKEPAEVIAVDKPGETYKKPDNQNTGEKYVSRYIFVGDSRYEGMEEFATVEDVVICRSGEGCQFLIDNLDEIRYHVVDKDSAIIIGLGVNDYKYNKEKYIETINALNQEGLCNIYYMLVNPVDENLIQYNGYNITNEEIDEFNSYMKSNLNLEINIIDTNSFLKNYGYVTEDGLHYDRDTYENIFWYLKNYVTNN